MLTNTHNHTCHFSPDAHTTIDEFIENAVRLGIKVAAITEHYEYDNPDPDDNIQTFDIKEYEKEFRKWKKKCPKELELLMGIEFGYQTHTASDIDRIASTAPFDIVLLSNHLFRGVDVFYSKEVYKLPVKQRHAEYVTKLSEMVENCNNFDVAAHYDYVNKCNKEPGVNMLYQDCPKEFDRFFEALIAKEKALEINTSTSARINQMPDPEVIKRYLAMGGRLITLSSDSHVKENIGLLIPEMREFLISLGVKEICWFKDRKVVTAGL
ncbi:MAG: histidinol-phosphatase HisJ family protein [Clostridiales bacterium]|nr:histidinol-phosphatase HisJ family protein [Clostridiales bacterium]